MTDSFHRPASPGGCVLTAIFLGAFAVRGVNLLLLSSDLANFFIEDAYLYWPGGSYIAATGQ
jgi:hypothetical protein